MNSFSVKKISQKNKFSNNNYSKRLTVITIILTVLGLIAVADASAPAATRAFSDKYYFLKQQVLSVAIGLISFAIVSKVPLDYFKKYSVAIFGVSIVFLLLVLLPGLGSRFLGARRWLIIGPISIQPSEFVKLGLALYLARLSETKDNLMAYIFPVILISGLIMLQPDLGTTIVVTMIGAVQIFLAGIPIIYMFLFGGMGVVAGYLMIYLSDYRRERLMTFLDQTRDPLGSGYHIRQVLLALGSGGLFGLGIGHSKQKFLFLPEAATDSIFAVIAEEVGFVGSSILLFIFFLYIYFGFKILISSEDTFERILTAGIVSWIGGQAMLNLASMVALTPLTGIPLPFFSYGGSSMVMVLTATGLLVNIGNSNGKAGK